MIRQFARFVFVGGINTAVDLAVLNVLIWGFDAGRDGALFAAFKTLAFSVAVANSYVLNKIWTFDAKDKKVEGTLTPFLLVSLIGLVFNVGGAYLFATFVPPPPRAMAALGKLLTATVGTAGALPQVWPSVASLVGTAAGLVWNFVGYRSMVFNKEPISLPEVEVETAPAAEPLI